MNKPMFIAGIVVLAMIFIWGFPPSGMEWIVIIAQIVIGIILISKSRGKPKPMPKSS